jgi:hypothetical protein
VVELIVYDPAALSVLAAVVAVYLAGTPRQQRQPLPSFDQPME